MRLCQPEPMVVTHGKILIRTLEMLECRDNIQQQQPLHYRRVIKSQTVRHSPSSIVTRQ